MDKEKKTLESWDYVVIASYFIFVLVVGLVSSRKGKQGSVSGYFLASRNTHWVVVGASLFASNIGSGHFIGLAGSGAASGIGIASFELNAIFVLMMLGWLFVPVYLSSGVYTMPEYLRERFGGQRIRIYLSCLSLILYIFTKISVDLYAGALFIQRAVGKESTAWLYLSILILLAIAAVFTVAGGLTAVLWTDFVQTILMVVGALVLMGMTLAAVGGYEAVRSDYFYAVPRNVSKRYADCGRPPPYAWSFFRPVDVGASDLPWTGMVFGATISSVWYWCTDQVIVQRTLASKSLIHAKGGCVFASALKFLPLFLLVIPGMASRILFAEEVACVEPRKCDRYCQSKVGCTNLAYILLVMEILPQGLRGLMLAVMLAALMSSLTSIFNSASTIFSIDIWQRIRKKAWKRMTDKAIEIEQLAVGRLFVIFLTFVSVLWIPVIQNSSGGQLFVYIQTVSLYFAPPICAIFVLAVFWERTNEPGVFWGLMSGLAIGIIRFIFEFSYIVPTCGAAARDTRPAIVKSLVGNIQFLHFGILLFFLTAVVVVSVSLLTAPIPSRCLHRLTWWSRNEAEVRLSIREVMKEPKDTDLRLSRKGSTSSSILSKDDPAWKKLLFRLCLFGSVEEEESLDVPIISAEEQAKADAEFLRESDKGKLVVNALAIATMVGATMLWGFYA